MGMITFQFSIIVLLTSVCLLLLRRMHKVLVAQPAPLECQELGRASCTADVSQRAVPWAPWKGSPQLGAECLCPSLALITRGAKTPDGEYSGCGFTGELWLKVFSCSLSIPPEDQGLPQGSPSLGSVCCPALLFFWWLSFLCSGKAR